MKKLEQLRQSLEPDLTRLNEPLKKHTTLGIGGPADIFYRPQTVRQLIRAVREARKLGVPVTMLGWGSNVLVSDKGIGGLVIKNETSKISIGKILPSRKKLKTEAPRWQADRKRGTLKYDFSDLNYDESGAPRIRVMMESGVSLPKAMNELLGRGITGLQWYARIPGTIGGAVFNNIHGGTHFIAEVVRKVKILDKENKVITLIGKELGLAYDLSRFHTSGEIILEAEFELFRGGAARAKRAALEWAKRKSLQPSNSAGCTFKNISNEDKERLGFPTTSAGYIIEHVLKMGGKRVGGAQVSAAHHNFIINAGGATAKDYLTLVNKIKEKTKKKLGIELEPEVIFLGQG